jgi:hypothetical protein
VATNLRIYACRHGTAHSAADLEGLFAKKRIRWMPSKTFSEEGHFIDTEARRSIEGCLLAYYLELRRKGGRP